MEGNKNGIATLLIIIAILIFIGGALLGYENRTYHYHSYSSHYTYEISIYYWSAAFISGSMFLGFAEIIKQLQGLNNKETYYLAEILKQEKNIYDIFYHIHMIKKIFN